VASAEATRLGSQATRLSRFFFGREKSGRSEIVLSAGDHGYHVIGDADFTEHELSNSDAARSLLSGSLSRRTRIVPGIR
jgi:hypothetical protein